ncbi:hypothetical protein ABEB36_012565, partial [Hypothenemus hampei]
SNYKEALVNYGQRLVDSLKVHCMKIFQARKRQLMHANPLALSLARLEHPNWNDMSSSDLSF